MTDRIRKLLLKYARVGTTITYSDLNQKCELGLDFGYPPDKKLMGELLGEISEHEHKRNRPLLSALVLQKSGKMDQGDGFYKMCERLGFGPFHELKSDRTFEKGQRETVYNFWKNDENYQKFKDDY